jgi:hypothetical protein
MEPTTSATPNPPAAIALRYGVLTGLIWVIVDFLIRIANLNFMLFGMAAGLAALLVGMTGIILAHRAFKQVNSSLMSYGQGVTISAILLLIAGIMSGLFNYTYLTYIDPDFVDRLQASMVDFMERNNVPEDQIAKSTVRFDEMRTSFGKALLTGVTNGLGGGVIMGLIISAFTKRNPSDFA